LDNRPVMLTIHLSGHLCGRSNAIRPPTTAPTSFISAAPLRETVWPPRVPQFSHRARAASRRSI